MCSVDQWFPTCIDRHVHHWQTKLPLRIEDEILKRDTFCALTGAKDNLIVNWIYPPWANCMVRSQSFLGGFVF